MKILNFIWYVLIISGTAYAVFFLHRSPWWFAMAVLFLSIDFDK